MPLSMLSQHLNPIDCLHPSCLMPAAWVAWLLREWTTLLPLPFVVLFCIFTIQRLFVFAFFTLPAVWVAAEGVGYGIAYVYVEGLV